MLNRVRYKSKNKDKSIRQNFRKKFTFSQQFINIFLKANSGFILLGIRRGKLAAPSYCRSEHHHSLAGYRVFTSAGYRVLTATYIAVYKVLTSAG
jgi:hypothetical protein